MYPYSALPQSVPQGFAGPQQAAPVAFASAPNPGQQQQVSAGGQQRDATAEFYEALQDPARWIIKQHVPIFKPHERNDPNTGKLIRVDVSKLHRIAQNMQRAEQSGVPVVMTLGHTDPNKPQTQQPPVAGYYRNPRVAAFGPNQEPAIVADEWLDPQYLPYRKNYPFRSAEYYDDDEAITKTALLNSDPFLQLGVVAYQRGEFPVGCSVSGLTISHTSASPLAIHYAQNGRVPVMYRLTIGDLPMFPPGAPQYPQAVPQAPQPFPVGYGQPQAPVPPTPLYPTPYGAQPAPVPPPQPPSYLYPYPQAPVNPYAAPQYPTPYGAPQPAMPWPGASHSKPPMHRQHPGGFLYGRQQPRRGYSRPAPYATEPPSVSGDMGGGMGGPGGGNPIQTAIDALGQAMEALQEYMEAETAAPQAPFPGGPGGPPGGMDGNPMTPASRYAYGQPPRRPAPQGPGRYGQYPRQPGRYQRAPFPGAPVGAPTGSPSVQYQLRMDQMNYQLASANQAIKVLMYERDEADTQECLAEIRRLAAEGFPVGEQELYELKQKPRAERPTYLENITTKYQKVPTDAPPTMPGDPTPQASAQPARPLTRDDMERAVEYAQQNPQNPQAYQQAINYMKAGQPVPYRHPALAGLPEFGRTFPPQPGAGPSFGEPMDYAGMAAGFDGQIPGHWGDPNGEPMNGQY